MRGKPSDEQPKVKWDIAKSPHHAEWLEYGPNSMQAMFDEDATVPTSSGIVLVMDNPVANCLWGEIELKHAHGSVSIWHVLNAIYEYFSEPITREDLDYLQRLDSSNHALILEAARSRLNAQPGSSPAFFGSRGMKRVDILGDKKNFWGLRCTEERDDGVWSLTVAFN